MIKMMRPRPDAALAVLLALLVTLATVAVAQVDADQNANPAEQQVDGNAASMDYPASTKGKKPAKKVAKAGSGEKKTGGSPSVMPRPGVRDRIGVRDRLPANRP